MNKKIIRLLTILCVVSIPASMEARDVTLRWEPNPEPDIAGYRMHHGEISGAWTDTIDVGNVVEYKVTDLPDDKVRYFAITAYDTDGLESVPSVEAVSYPRDLNMPRPENIQVIPTENENEVEVLWTYPQATATVKKYIVFVHMIKEGIAGRNVIGETQTGEEMSLVVNPWLETRADPPQTRDGVYSVSVAAVDEANFRSSRSEEVVLVDQVLPQPPTNLQYIIEN